jgi:hypothetical protein
MASADVFGDLSAEVLPILGADCWDMPYDDSWLDDAAPDQTNLASDMIPGLLPYSGDGINESGQGLQGVLQIEQLKGQVEALLERVVKLESLRKAAEEDRRVLVERMERLRVTVLDRLKHAGAATNDFVQVSGTYLDTIPEQQRTNRVATKPRA